MPSRPSTANNCSSCAMAVSLYGSAHWAAQSVHVLDV
jgi:hypothetical protein